MQTIFSTFKKYIFQNHLKDLHDIYIIHLEHDFDAENAILWHIFKWDRSRIWLTKDREHPGHLCDKRWCLFKWDNQRCLSKNIFLHILHLRVWWEAMCAFMCEIRIFEWHWKHETFWKFALGTAYLAMNTRKLV